MRMCVVTSRRQQVDNLASQGVMFGSGGWLKKQEGVYGLLVQVEQGGGLKKSWYVPHKGVSGS